MEGSSSPNEASLPAHTVKSCLLAKNTSRNFAGLSTAQYAAWKVNRVTNITSIIGKPIKPKRKGVLVTTKRTTRAKMILNGALRRSLPTASFSETRKSTRTLTRKTGQLENHSNSLSKERIYRSKIPQGDTVSKIGVTKKKNVICSLCKLQKLDWPFCGLTGEPHLID